MRATLPTELMVRLMNASPEQFAAVENILGLNAERGAGSSEFETEPATDDEARRLFALLKALESDGNYRKAPVTRVFQLYCLEGLTRDEVAKKCQCVPSLVTLRLQAIESKLGRKASELRQLSGHFEQIADSLKDDRARRIRRESAMDEDYLDGGTFNS